MKNNLFYNNRLYIRNKSLFIIVIFIYCFYITNNQNKNY